MRIITKWLLNTFVILLISKFIPGIEVSGIYTALIVAGFWGIANVVIRPVLIILTLPITILTLGMFVFVINALIFWFLATFIQGFSVSGFAPAFLGTLIISIVGYWGDEFMEKRQSNIEDNLIQ